MLKIYLILILFYSLNVFAHTSKNNHIKNIKIQKQNEEVQIALPFGAIGKLFRNAGKSANKIKGSGSKNLNKLSDDFYSNPKYTKVQKSSFNWGFNPNPTAISRGLKEMFEYDREGYNELSTWDCPINIQNSEFMSNISKQERCIAYQMRCNVIVRNNMSSGSGFFVNSRTIITNYHVINTDTVNIKIIPFTDRKEYSGEVIAYSKKNDLAALKIQNYGNITDIFASNNFKSCNLSTNNPEINSSVIAIGSPQNRLFSVTVGSLEKFLDQNFEELKINLKNFAHWIQMNAFITYGSSGGPLLHKGWIIGVNTGSYNDKNIAIHFDKLQKFLNNNEIKNSDYDFNSFKKVIDEKYLNNN